jgi:hypothetical protein
MVHLRLELKPIQSGKYRSAAESYDTISPVETAPEQRETAHWIPVSRTPGDAE